MPGLAAVSAAPLPPPSGTTGIADCLGLHEPLLDNPLLQDWSGSLVDELSCAVAPAAVPEAAWLLTSGSGDCSYVDGSGGGCATESRSADCSATSNGLPSPSTVAVSSKRRRARPAPPASKAATPKRRRGETGAPLPSEAATPKRRRRDTSPRKRQFSRHACQADGCPADLSCLPYHQRRNHICSVSECTGASTSPLPQIPGRGSPLQGALGPPYRVPTPCSKCRVRAPRQPAGVREALPGGHFHRPSLPAPPSPPPRYGLQEHLRAESYPLRGELTRFCQQCGMGHPLEAFDGAKRCCRVSLERRKRRA